MRSLVVAGVALILLIVLAVAIQPRSHTRATSGEPARSHTPLEGDHVFMEP